MTKWGKPQLVAVAVALVAIVLLVMAPRIPPGNVETVPMDPAEIQLAEAVALVNGSEPMRGIMMLREILEKDPGNAEAHWHLGLFSVQSGQFDKAAERFHKVIELDEAGHPEAWFYLGRTQATLDSIPQALESLRKYRTLTQDTAILHGVDRLVKDLENELTH